LSYLGQAGILLVLRPSGMSEIFVCIGATSVAALAWQLTLSRPRFLRPFKRELVQDAWKLGKFALVGNIVGIGILQLPSWAIEVFHGRATVGSYQALANLIGLANPVIFSMGALLTPAVVRASLTGRDHARRSALRHGLRFGLLLLPAFLLLAMAPHHVMLLVYGYNSPYLALAPFLRVFSVTFVLQFIGSVIGGYEGGLARPRSYMYSQFCCLGVLATAGLLLIYFYGIAGAVYASLIAAAARMLGFLYVSIRSDRSHKAVAASLQEVQEVQ
jgi:O-antigen/teichoic acid export membrane protein